MEALCATRCSVCSMSQAFRCVRCERCKQLDWGSLGACTYMASASGCGALTEHCAQANARKMQVRLQKPCSSADLAADIVEKALATGKRC